MSFCRDLTSSQLSCRAFILEELVASQPEGRMAQLFHTSVDRLAKLVGGDCTQASNYFEGKILTVLRPEN
jgi:hypothetical protein